MKKIILLGDSIRLIGYGETVANRLTGEYEVWQPADNCRYAKYTLRQLFDWKDKIEGADVIHWNNGHWDACDYFGDGPFSPIERYAEDMARAARILKQLGKTVIFATTTPMRDGYQYSSNERVQAFNAKIVPILAEMGVVINDLYTPISKDIDRYICNDKLHLSEEGIIAAADVVEAVIRREAEKL